MNLASRLRRIGGILAASVLAVGATDAAQAAPPDPMATSPAGASNAVPHFSEGENIGQLKWQLTCNGAEPVSFKTISGLPGQNEIVEYKSSSERYKGPRGVPSKNTFAEIALKSATGEAWLFKWREMVIKGDAAHAKRPCDITATAENGSVVARYSLRNALPKNLNTRRDEKLGVVTDLTLAVEGTTRLK